MYKYIFIHIYICVYTYIHTFVYACVCMCAYTNHLFLLSLHTYIHAYIYICIYMYIYADTYTFLWHIHRPPPTARASDVYSRAEKEDLWRSCSKESCPERNRNQMLPRSRLAPSLTCPYAEQHGKRLLDEFTAEKTI